MNTIVLAKRPVPGRVKTRLCPPLTPQQAADLAAAALRDTIGVVSATATSGRFLAFDGAPGEWLPATWTAVRQGEGGLDRRLSTVFTAVATAGPALLVGMDTPQLRSDDLTGFDPARYDACLGPARDGGYWAIGFADPGVAAAAIVGVPMSQDDTGDRQLSRLRRLGLRVQLLEQLQDVDTFTDAEQVAQVCADRGTGRAYRAAFASIIGPASDSEPASATVSGRGGRYAVVRGSAGGIR